MRLFLPNLGGSRCSEKKLRLRICAPLSTRNTNEPIRAPCAFSSGGRSSLPEIAVSLSAATAANRASLYASLGAGVFQMVSVESESLRSASPVSLWLGSVSSTMNHASKLRPWYRERHGFSTDLAFGPTAINSLFSGKKERKYSR